MSSEPMETSPIYMSGAALPELPSPTPSPMPASGPQAVGPQDPRPKSRGWIWGVVLAGAAGAGYWYWTTESKAGEAASTVVVRTAALESGRIERTIRLTGVTAAEKYVSLIAPSLRGGRSGGGGGGTVGGGGGMANMSGGGGRSGGGGGATSGGGGSSSGGGGSTGGGGGSSAGGGMAAGGGQGGSGGGGDTLASTSGAAGAGGALRSARSASGRVSAAPAAARTSTTRSSSSGNSLGSTAGALQGGGGPPGGGGGGGGGGRGGNEFMLQIQALAKSGSPAKKGEVVAEFDRQYMLQRLDDFKSTVTQAEADFRKQIAELQITRKSYEQQVLMARNAVEKAELDIKTVPVRSAIDSERLRLAVEETKANLKQLLEARKYLDIGEKAQVRSAELELQATKLEYRRSEANADRMLVKAPIDGLVVMQNTFRGSEFGAIQQGDQVYPGGLFMQIVDPSSMIINATVNQSDVQSMRIGQKAKIRFDAFPGLELPGRLIVIGAITKAGGSRAQFKKDVPVKFRLEKMDPRVIPDLSVSADVILEEQESVAAIAPLEAIQQTEPGSKPFVLVKGAAGQWERREVELGVASYTHVALKSGVKSGEVVALEKPPTGPPNSESKSS
jgi:HlyD family secretion protein